MCTICTAHSRGTSLADPLVPSNRPRFCNAQLRRRQFDWLMRYGREALGGLRLLSTKPLKVDWTNARFLPWQQVLLEEQINFEFARQLDFRSPTGGYGPIAVYSKPAIGNPPRQRRVCFSPIARSSMHAAGQELTWWHWLSRTPWSLSIAIALLLELARSNMRAHGCEADYVQAELPCSALYFQRILSACGSRSTARHQERETRTTQGIFHPPLTATF